MQSHYFLLYYSPQLHEHQTVDTSIHDLLNSSNSTAFACPLDFDSTRIINGRNF